MNKITSVIPTYNNLEYLKFTIDSIKKNSSLKVQIFKLTVKFDDQY